MAKVNERSARCAGFYEERHLLRTLRSGTKAMRQAREEYLPIEPGESKYSYENRLRRSVLFNGTKRAIDANAAKPFVRPVSVSSATAGQDALVSSYEKNLDGKGASTTALARKALQEVLWDGAAYLIVDAPKAGGRAYCYVVKGADILGYSFDEDDRLVYLRILEKTVVVNGYDEAELQKVREWKVEGAQAYWRLHQQSEPGKDEFIIVQDWTAFAVAEIPLIPIFADNVPSGELFCPPPFIDLAYLNLQHWQESSDQSNILHVARIPILFASGISEDVVIKVGADKAIFGNENSDLKFVEHTGAAIGAGRQSLQDIELRMQIYGYEMLANRGAAETATGRSLQANENNSQIAAIAQSLQDALKKAFWFLGKFNLISDLQVDVSVCTDYGVTITVEELNALSTARQMGDLSHDDYLKELKRRGILRADFDIAANDDRLLQEVPLAS
ncbi:TPA: DUF4055 domain-containing protein [Pseudomonas aeruginosa]|nr:DUF4055 domain-containing protein [Pseudomonas aeruginosa]